MSQQYVRFLVLGEGRTGSNLLVQALQSHPQIVCFREVFNWTHKRIDYRVPGYEKLATSDLKLRREAPLRLLSERIFRDWPSDVRAVGFKLHYGHALGYEGVEEALVSDRDLRVIHLRRDNAIRTLVSMKLAERSGEWERDESPSLRVRAQRLWHRANNLATRTDPGAPIYISPDECNRFIIAHTLQGQRYDRLFAAHQQLHLTYESMVADFTARIGDIQRFLGVSLLPSEISLQQQRARQLACQITNYVELRAAFAGTPHEAWLDD